MEHYKIFMSNIGYARGLNGCLKQHILHSYRHIYCPLKVQVEAISQLKTIIENEKPDIGCLLEIDKGSFNTGYYNQIEKIIDQNYPYFNIENKYSKKGYLNKLPIFNGKSNALFSNNILDYQKLSFSHGTKKLIYRINLKNNITLFFAHFSLRKNIRSKQFKELRSIVESEDNDVIIMGDFNIFNGFQELYPLIHKSDLCVINDEKLPTFTFHKWKFPIDLCICSSKLSDKVTLNIIDQPYSDHAALILKI